MRVFSATVAATRLGQPPQQLRSCARARDGSPR